MEERVEQVETMKMNPKNEKLSKYTGLRAAMAAELMIGFGLELEL